jgi:hypothetical protein
VADEVVALDEPLRDPVRVALEVDGLERPGREAGALQHHELGLVGHRATLLAPRGTAADDAPVDEDNAFHRCH